MFDLDGLAVGGGRSATDAWNRSVVALHALSPQVTEEFDAAVAAEPGQVAVRSMRAMLARPLALPYDPAAEIDAADIDRASDRELSMLAAARQFTKGGPAAAAATFVEHLQWWPTDTAVALPAYVAIIASCDDALLAALRLATARQFKLAPGWRTAHSEAFCLLEERKYDEAAVMASAALDERPDCGLAVHTLTHWHYETGDHEAGRTWLDEWRDGREIILYSSHFAWHSALHGLALGDGARVQALLAEQIADTALPDVGSLRWRLRLAGQAVPARPEATEIAKTAIGMHLSPVMVWQAAFSAAADGDADFLRAEAEYARSWPSPGGPLLARVLDGVACAVEGSWTDAADALGGLTASNVRALGGSHAQREVIEDTRIVSLVNAQRFDEARIVLDERLSRRRHAVDTELVSRCVTTRIPGSTRGACEPYGMAPQP